MNSEGAVRQNLIARHKRYFWGGFVLLVVVGWSSLAMITRHVWRLKGAEHEARVQAELESSMRLALWRIDAFLSPLIAQESARPITADTKVVPEEIELGVVRRFTWNGSNDQDEESIDLVRIVEVLSGHFESSYVANHSSPALNQRNSANNALTQAPSVFRADQFEFGNRAMLVESNSITQQNFNNFRNAEVSGPDSMSLAVGIWDDQRMALVRRIEKQGTKLFQIAELDWERLRNDSLALIADILPQAELVPVAFEVGRNDPDMLASLPVKLVGGSLSSGNDQLRVDESSTSRSLVGVLAFSWGIAAIGTIAAGCFVHGLIQLNERRSSFVSAVTHELRTPLTTVQLYADMLLNGMVADSNQQREYLEVLQNESLRLNHLVENVLALSRLERRSNSIELCSSTFDELIERNASQLHSICRRVGKEMVIVPGDAMQVPVLVQPELVGQILVNVIDNACKYTAHAEDNRILLECRCHDRTVELNVRDFGDGLKPKSQFRTPFFKSAPEAAESKPGVGLGIYLCRRFAKTMQGRFQIESSNPGTRVILEVKRVLAG